MPCVLSNLTCPELRGPTATRVRSRSRAVVRGQLGFGKQRRNVTVEMAVRPCSNTDVVGTRQQARKEVALDGKMAQDIVKTTAEKMAVASAFGLIGFALNVPDAAASEGLASVLAGSLVLGEISPDTAAAIAGVLKPIFGLGSLLFIARIVMSWDPNITGKSGPWAVPYLLTEPILGPTRKVIQPVNGVDISPIVWFALTSFCNEILVGPQGLLILLSNKVG